MSTIHRVVQGDHMDRIALAHGFLRFETIWNAPENEVLRNARESPFALLPGDEVFIPDKVVHTAVRPVNVEHPFVVHRRPLRVVLRLLDVFGEALADRSCTVSVDGGPPAPGATDSGGEIAFEVPRGARRGVVSVELGGVFHVELGALDPLPEPTGVAGRLHNLGYPVGDPRRDDLDTQAWTEFGVELFRHDRGQAEVAELDPALVEALAQEHDG